MSFVSRWIETEVSAEVVGQDAEALLAEARGIFEELGATPWIARVAAAQSSVSVDGNGVSQAAGPSAQSTLT